MVVTYTRVLDDLCKSIQQSLQGRCRLWNLIIYLLVQLLRFASRKRPGGHEQLYPKGLVALSRHIWLQLFPSQIFGAVTQYTKRKN